MGTVRDEWQRVINEYLVFLIAIGRPKTTRRLRKYQLQYLAMSLNLLPNAITEDDLLGWFGSHDWKPETRRSYRSGIRGFFAWATKNGIVTDDPSLEIPQVQRGTPVPRPAPDHVWREAIVGADARVSLMLRLAAEVGMRRGEVACVAVQDLRWSVSGPQLLVHGKGNRERLVPISEDLARLIELGAAGHTPGESAKGWLFPGPWGGHLSPAWVGTLVSRLMPEVWTMHTLRHRFATRAYVGSNGDIRAVQKLLGHANLAVTERYVDLGDDAMRAAMRAAAVA